MRITSVTGEVLNNYIDQLLEIDRHTPGERWNLENFLFELPMKWQLSEMLVGELNQVEGFLIASFRNSVFHIHRLAIREEYKGKGLGKKLILSLADKARTSQIETITLKVALTNESAIKFYEHLGFVTSMNENNNAVMKLEIS